MRHNRWQQFLRQYSIQHPGLGRGLIKAASREYRKSFPKTNAPPERKAPAASAPKTKAPPERKAPAASAPKAPPEPKTNPGATKEAVLRPGAPPYDFVVSRAGSWAFQGRRGAYAVDAPSSTLTTTMDGLGERASRVVWASVDATGAEFDPKAQGSLSSVGIKQHVGSIMVDVQTPMKWTTTRRQRMFVLPSQLNAAEYAAKDLSKSELASYGLEEYLHDGTGGPRGQLSADLGVAKFIIDNATNETRRGKGIDNVRLMGDIDGVSLKNGYLEVDGSPDVRTFSQRLPRMTVMGVKDVPVRGLKAFGSPNVKHTFVDLPHTVDLVYASAVPYGTYGNQPKTPSMLQIVGMTIFGQYVAALRLAIARGGCDVYLMPWRWRFGPARRSRRP